MDAGKPPALVHLVIVSHSRRLAEGVVELARQMAPPELAVSAVGGLAEDETLLGTDAVQIAEALQRHTGPAGALILVDLGSAVISTELALDLLPADLRGRCRISNAALVEGAVIAAVEAGLGHSLEEVNRAAEAAWTMTKTAEAP